MHELGIAKDFWEVIQQQVKANNLKKVTKITLVIGEASGIEPDFLRHSLKDHTLPGTLAQDAELEFIAVPLSAKCRNCSLTIDTDTLVLLSCPNCSSADIEIVSGKETYIQSIEGE